MALEDESYVLAQVDGPALVERRNVAVQDLEPSLLHATKGPDQCQQRCLARARRPGHDHDLPAADL
jgi:hypothetical protein